MSTIETLINFAMPFLAGYGIFTLLVELPALRKRMTRLEKTLSDLRDHVCEIGDRTVDALDAMQLQVGEVERRMATTARSAQINLAEPSTAERERDAALRAMDAGIRMALLEQGHGSADQASRLADRVLRANRNGARGGSVARAPAGLSPGEGATVTIVTGGGGAHAFHPMPGDTISAITPPEAVVEREPHAARSGRPRDRALDID